MSPKKLTELGVWNRTARNRIRPVSERWRGFSVYFMWFPFPLQAKHEKSSKNSVRSFEKGLADLFPMPLLIRSRRTQFWGTFFAVFWVLLVTNPLPPTPFRNLWFGEFGAFLGAKFRSKIRKIRGLFDLHLSWPNSTAYLKPLLGSFFEGDIAMSWLPMFSPCFQPILADLSQFYETWPNLIVPKKGLQTPRGPPIRCGFVCFPP